MVNRVRVWIAVCGLALAGCGGSGQPLIPEPPVAFERWDRAGLERPPVVQAPEGIRALKPAQWVRTSYRNKDSGGSVLVEAFGMPVESSAFEAQQKWRNEPGTVSFRNGKVFAVCSSPTEGTQSLITFSRQLETAWLPARQ